MVFESSVRCHGGSDALGPIEHDFSTNSNACGPCPQALLAAQEADCRVYPDPEYRQLRVALANFHGVAVDRVVLAGSASEFIFRITALVSRLTTGKKTSASVYLPAHHYGDYAHAAVAWGLQRVPNIAQANLVWFCQPSSPLGQVDDNSTTQIQALQPSQVAVLDCAYQNLCLEFVPAVPVAVLSRVWQLWTPNKALGLTGIRAAYAIAPVHASALIKQLEALAPSWVIGAQGVAMLQAWSTAGVQHWLADSRQTLLHWKARQLKVLRALGGDVYPSVTNYGVWRPGIVDMQAALRHARSQGIKCRDATSFGLAGHLRLGVLSPVAQDALQRVWQQLTKMGIS